MKLLMDAVSARIQTIAAIAKEHEADLETYARQLVEQNDNAETQSVETEAARISKRAEELDKIIGQLFENYALGNLSVDRYLTLSGKYEKEQADIKKRLKKLDKVLVANNGGCAKNALQLLQAVQIYTEVETLTRQMLLDLIDKIVVHEATGQGKDRQQTIEIYFRFIGAAGRQGEFISPLADGGLGV